MKKNIVIVILLIALIGMGGYIYYNKFFINEKQPVIKNNEEKPKQEVLEVTDPLVVGAIDKIDDSLNYQCGTESIYMTDKKVTIKDINNELAYATVMMKLAFNDLASISATQLDQAIAETFGKDYVFEHKTYGGCPLYEYDAASGNYNLSQKICGSTCGPTNETKIVKAIKSTDTLEIYERIIYVDTGAAQGDALAYCKDATRQQIVGYLTSNDRMYNNKKKEELIAKGSLYKLTFKLEDNNYIFVSSEKEQ